MSKIPDHDRNIIGPDGRVTRQERDRIIREYLEGWIPALYFIGIPMALYFISRLIGW